MKEILGISGRIATFFQTAPITPLLALAALLLGIFAVIATPREEEPQINVTMANVLIAFPGAGVKDVESMVSIPAEQVLSRIADIEHVTSLSRPGIAVLTVQFKVGVPRTEALVRLYDTLASNRDWLPKGLGVQEPIVKPKGIDDVPIVSLTLWSKDEQYSPRLLEQVAHSIESEIKRVKGTRDITTIGGPGRAIIINIDPTKLAATGLTVLELQQALQTANSGMPLGELISGNHAIAIEAGSFLRDARDIANLVVGERNRRPIYLQEVASISDGALPAVRSVWHGVGGRDGPSYPAVTIQITKQPGQNAVNVAQAIVARINNLRNTVIPSNVEVTITRNYGETANDKAQTLIKKLFFATLSVVALVFFALGWREAAIVGVAVVLTLAVTLFASWAWGFTLNRVSLFALIFSIGIVVDDAIVVVENIHRHQQRFPDMSFAELIPRAVDEVGGPTILATLTVIAALLPMAFVTGLMGPYMSPIPINASMGMLLSLGVAFVVTPWLATLWMKNKPESHHVLTEKLSTFFQCLFRPFMDQNVGRKNRKKLWLVIIGLISLSVALPLFNLVQLKMLPFDNKSEFQIIVDMPKGTPLETTSAVLQTLGEYLKTLPEVTHFQTYAGTTSPITFNGLVRQYYFRTESEMGDIQVNLVDRHHRKDKSHTIASRIRDELQKIARAYGAKVKLVEVPPGPPVLAPIVAEIYGPSDEGRYQVAKSIRAIFEKTNGVVDIDDSSIANSPRILLLVDRRKAASMGVSQQDIVTTLRTGLAGSDVTYLHDQSKYPAAAVMKLPESAQGNLDTLLQLRIKSATGQNVPLRELVILKNSKREQELYHKDGLPVHYVIGDMAGKVDSPLYGMFSMRNDIHQMAMPGGGKIAEYFANQPNDPYRGFSLKWDGEWQVTYETFRDMGIAYVVGLVLIYLLVVAQFSSYLIPLIIMAPIPLTVIGVMPGHALLGAQFTATSMIGMIALAGIIVRNSILLVNFINQQIADGHSFEDAVINSAITRSQPIALTGLAAMLGAFFILDDPIFNGLAVSLIFGIFVSTILTLLVIPLLYYSVYKHQFVKK